MSDPDQRKLFNTAAMTSTAAMRRLKRPAMEAPYKKPLPMFPKERMEPEPELHMPDEERNFALGKLPCPRCGGNAFMRRFKQEGKMMYQVYCGLVRECGNETPARWSSGEAVAVWKMAAILTQ